MSSEYERDAEMRQRIQEYLALPPDDPSRFQKVADILNAVPTMDLSSYSERERTLNTPRWQAAVAETQRMMEEAADKRKAEEEERAHKELLGWLDRLMG